MSQRVYLTPSPAWEALRPYRVEEMAGVQEESEMITEPHLLEELLDVLLLINSSYVCVHSLYALQEAPAVLCLPYEIEYHPSIGGAMGIVQKIIGRLQTVKGEEDESPSSGPMEFGSLVDDWMILWQGINNLNRYGTLQSGGDLPFERKEASLTAQALAHALQQYLDDHYDMVIRLESKLRQEDQLTVQSLWHHLQQTIVPQRVLAVVLRDLLSPSISGSESSIFGAQQTMRQGAAILHCIYEHLQSLAG
jgi:hypothetical protein